MRLLAALLVLASTSFAATVLAARVQVEIDRLPAHNVSKALFRYVHERRKHAVPQRLPTQALAEQGTHGTRAVGSD